ncbi:MAG: hypothetical protein Q9220_000266 [cf. Caloplaca sp. 1 TL-2023]
MLSRGNSEASARLRRAKSSTSIKTRHSTLVEPNIPDPYEAKHHALAAASHAFGRAHGCEYSSLAPVELSTNFEPGHPLTRSKSIRFAGPTALPSRNLPITTRIAPTVTRPIKRELRSLHSGLSRSNSSVQGDEGFMATLPSHGEYVETRVASQPSSYKRLRKSKSMFSPRSLPLASLSTTTQSTAPRTASHSHSAFDKRERRRGDTESRLGRSLSFFGLNAGKEPLNYASSNSTTQNEAIGLARDQYFHQLEQSKENTQSWTKQAAIDRRSQRTFRKSVRTSSSNSCGSAVEPPGKQSREEMNGRGIGSKARNLSASFKNKFKRVFIRSSSGEGSFPAQQLHATRPHFGDSTVPLAASDMQYQDILHIPRRRSSPVACQNINGDCDIGYSNSRVTSWTDSSAANTMNGRQAMEPKTLSVIQEHGSLKAHDGSLQRSGAFRAQHAGLLSQPRSNSLYTKLNQRIQKINDASQPVSYNGHADFSPSQRSDLQDSPSKENKKTESYDVVLRDQSQAPLIPSSTASHMPTLEAISNIHALQTADDSGTTVRQNKIKAESPRRPLRESKSMFFPPSTRIERTKTSPFRQAMQSSSWVGVGTDVISIPQAKSDNASYVPTQTGASTGSLTRSESIYSRRSSGSTPQPHRSDTSLVEVEDRNRDSLSTKASRSSVQETGQTSRPSTPQSSTDQSSVPQQDQVTLQPRRLQVEAPSSKSPHVESMNKRRGHKREHAQICDDDTDIGRLDYLISLSQTGSGGRGVAASPPLRHTSSQPMLERFPLMNIGTRVKMNSGDKGALAMPSLAPPHSMHNENRPPARRAFNDTHLLHVERPDLNTRFPKGIVEGSGKPLKVSPKTIEIPIQPHHGNVWPSIAPESHSRSSPERVARLRRMHSSSTLRSLDVRPDATSSPSLKQQSPVHQRDSRERPTTPATDGRTMVDVFLSNRKAAQSSGAQVSAFI